MLPLPFKLNQAGRHHIPRQRHRVTNWPAYDASLRQRGSLTVWFTDEAIAACLHRFDTGLLPLSDELALHLGDHAQHGHEDRSSGILSRAQQNHFARLGWLGPCPTPRFLRRALLLRDLENERGAGLRTLPWRMPAELAAKARNHR